MEVFDEWRDICVRFQASTCSVRDKKVERADKAVCVRFAHARLVLDCKPTENGQDMTYEMLKKKMERVKTKEQNRGGEEGNLL